MDFGQIERECFESCFLPLTGEDIATDRLNRGGLSWLGQLLILPASTATKISRPNLR